MRSVSVGAAVIAVGLLVAGCGGVEPTEGGTEVAVGQRGPQSNSGCLCRYWHGRLTRCPGYFDLNADGDRICFNKKLGVSGFAILDSFEIPVLAYRTPCPRSSVPEGCWLDEANVPYVWDGDQEPECADGFCSTPPIGECASGGCGTP